MPVSPRMSARALMPSVEFNGEGQKSCCGELEGLESLMGEGDVEGAGVVCRGPSTDRW